MALQAGLVKPGRKPGSCEMVDMMCLTGTGDLVRDMKNQVKANVRTELLEWQKDRLQNSKICFHIWENEGTDQLCITCTADQHLLFSLKDCTLLLPLKFKI